MKIRLIVLTLAAVVTAAACGQKGPLRLPDPAKPGTLAEAARATNPSPTAAKS